MAVASNPWYTSVPTVLPTTKPENDLIAGYTELASSGRFSQSKDKENILIDIICNGYAGEGTSTREEMLATVPGAWNGASYLKIKNDAWTRLQEFFATLK